jgi:hypothetical protein
MCRLTANILLLLPLILGLMAMFSTPAFAGKHKAKISDEQIKLLRTQHTVWVPIEAGAPMLHFVVKMRNPLDEEQLTSEQMRIVEAFSLFVQKAKIKPGVYKLTNDWKTEYPDGKCELGADTRYVIPIPQTDKFDFHLTKDHVRLLNHANYNGPGFDVKRPYGDMSYYQLDMADALGLKVPRGEGGKPNFSEKEFEHYDKLHGEMLFALQALLQYGKVK